ncbi:hypothetical protein [Paremcibacter congregatus]|nr:hypothetical protein [Paremcibacter congregatus]
MAGRINLIRNANEQRLTLIRGKITPTHSGSPGFQSEKHPDQTPSNNHHQ